MPWCTHTSLCEVIMLPNPCLSFLNISCFLVLKHWDKNNTIILDLTGSRREITRVVNKQFCKWKESLEYKFLCMSDVGLRKKRTTKEWKLCVTIQKSWFLLSHGCDKRFYHSAWSFEYLLYLSGTDSILSTQSLRLFFHYLVILFLCLRMHCSLFNKIIQMYQSFFYI